MPGIDVAYDATANSPLDWSNQEVVQWVANLKLKQYVDNCRASGITGLPLLEATKVDLEITLGIFDTKVVSYALATQCPVLTNGMVLPG